MRTLCLLAAVSLIAAGAPVGAQANSDDITVLKAQVEALSRRVAELEAGRAQGVEAQPATATAAAPRPEFTPRPAAERAAAGVSGRVPPAPLDRPLQPSGAAFQVSAGSGSGDVSIKLSTRVARPNLRGAREGTATDDTLTVTASAPLDKNNPRTDLGTLDGFANSSNVKLRWTRFAARIRNARLDPRNQAIEQWARDACRAKAAGDPLKLAVCNGPISDQFILEHTDAATHDQYLALGFPDVPSFAFGGEGTIGYKKFGYLDPATLTSFSSEKYPWGLKGFVSVLPGPALTAITGALEYQSAFEEQKATVFCPPGSTAPVQCVSGAPGAPAHKRKLLGSLEVRHLLTMPENGFLSSIGISGQVTHDFRSGVSGFDLPIYLIPDEKGNLLGGFRFGYRTDSDDLSVGVFVGSAFSIR